MQSNLRRMASREGVLRVGLVWSLLLGAPFPALAQSAGPSLIDLADMSLEELLRIEVTTASKKPESLLDAPAIMVVLTESDIHAYGGRSLVEVLDRTTSVFFMGNQENLQGALTMRGDATLGSNNHILVLVNGRPIQESTHGGMIHPFLRSFPLGIRQADRDHPRARIRALWHERLCRRDQRHHEGLGFRRRRGRLVWGVRYQDRVGGGREERLGDLQVSAGITLLAR